MKTIADIKQMIKDLENEDMHLTYMRSKEQAIITTRYDEKKEANFEKIRMLEQILEGKE